VLGFCGLRWGEAIALRVRDIEFLKRRLQVSENAVQLNSRFVVGVARTGRFSCLSSCWTSCRHSAGAGTWMTSFSAMASTIFCGRSRSADGSVRAVKAAGVQRVTPHDLRHACASIAISAGVNVLALQRMLGNKSAKVTLDTYADLFDTDLDAVAAAIDSKCAQSVPKSAPRCSK